MPFPTRRHVDAIALGSMASLVLIFLALVPLRVPLFPYVYASGVANLKAVAESLRAHELPEWNPYLGGGYPLSPTPYYLLYGLGRSTTLLAVLAVSLCTYLAFRSRLLAATLALPSLAAVAYTLHPAPALVVCYLAGLATGSPARRTLGSLALPELALCVELALRSPSPWPLIASLACTADDLASYLAESINRMATSAILSPLTIAYCLGISVSLAVTVTLGYLLHRALGTRWKAPALLACVLAAASLLHPGLVMGLAFPYVLALSEALRYADSVLAGLERRHRRVLASAALMSLTFIPLNMAELSYLAKPRMTIAGSVTVGSGSAVAVVSSDPWFTEVVHHVLRGRPVVNPPFLSTTPATATFAILMTQVGDSRYVAFTPSSSVEPRVLQLKLKILRIVSPGHLAAQSSDQLTLAYEWSRLNGIKPVSEPLVLTPRTLSGHGLVAQSFSPWWKPHSHRRPGPAGLMVLNGRVRYDRPTAPFSLLLALLSITAAAVRPMKRRAEQR
ncbi:hypothetical protein [Methanopyrus sp.]